MKTPLSSIVTIIISTFFFAAAQFFFKKGAATLTYDVIAAVTNTYLIMGVILYGISGLLMILSLRKGELSVIHPFFGVSFVWVLLLSVYMLHEPVHINNIIGLCAIFFGLLFIGGTAS